MFFLGSQNLYVVCIVSSSSHCPDHRVHVKKRCQPRLTPEVYQGFLVGLMASSVKPARPDDRLWLEPSFMSPVQSCPVQSSPVQSSPVQSSPVQSSRVKSSSVQSSEVESSPVQFSSVQFSSVQFSSVQSSPVQSSSVQFSSVQFSSVQFSSVQFSPALPCPALPCPALPCPALPCPALPVRLPGCLAAWLIASSLTGMLACLRSCHAVGRFSYPLPCPPTGLPAWPPRGTPGCLPAYLPACLPAWLPTGRLACWHAILPANPSASFRVRHCCYVVGLFTFVLHICLCAPACLFACLPALSVLPTLKPLVPGRLGAMFKNLSRKQL